MTEDFVNEVANTPDFLNPVAREFVAAAFNKALTNAFDEIFRAYWPERIDEL